jgi:DMSO/TMAO reductase YedYZ molybdopterin-dependent catalytic subunit
MTEGGRRTASVVGVVAGLAGLATAELVAGLVDGVSPVVSVGDVVIDRVPAVVRDLAIDVFGAADKAALVVGILVVLVLLAGAVGRLAVRRPELAAVAVAGIGLVGVLGARNDDTPLSFVPDAAPSAVGAAVAVAVLRWGRRWPEGPLDDAVVVDAPVLARRHFLGFVAVVGATAAGVGAVGRVLQRSAGAAASRAAVVLPRAARRLRAVPAGADLGIDGVAPFVTPNGDFYRIDTALLVPQVRTEGWTLRVHGMVEHELELTYDDLLARELVEADVTLACVSNEVGGDLIGNARWLGARLDELLREAGVQRGATQLVPRSSDGFAAGFPTEVALDGRDALVAVGMNGEPLPLRHGFPARLVVPGLYGYVSATKWLTEIELTTWDAFDSYWVRRGWAKEAPIKTQSRIDTPRSAASLRPGRVAVAGVAWAQGRGIEAVEVQVDDGPWRPARLATAVGDDTWRQWVYEWDAEDGDHVLAVRATDGTGKTQPEERVAPIPDGATGWHTIEVSVSG